MGKRNTRLGHIHIQKTLDDVSNVEAVYDTSEVNRDL
jgi:hypothetical protein